MATNTVNHYDCLQVRPDACPEVIRAAYRALSQRWHPDKQELNESLEQREEAEAMMRAINEAYEVLANPQSRKHYDRECGYAKPARKRKAGSARSAAAEDEEDKFLSQQTGQGPWGQVSTNIAGESLGGFATRMWWILVLFSFPALSVLMFGWIIEDWQGAATYDLVMLIVGGVMHLVYADYAYSCLFRHSLFFFRGKPLSDYEVGPDEHDNNRFSASFTLLVCGLIVALCVAFDVLTDADAIVGVGLFVLLVGMFSWCICQLLLRLGLGSSQALGWLQARARRESDEEIIVRTAP